VHHTALQSYPDITIVHNGDWSGPATVLWHPDGAYVRWETTGEELISGKLPDEIRATDRYGRGFDLPVNVATRAVAIAVRCALSQHLVRIGEDVMGFRAGEEK